MSARSELSTDAVEPVKKRRRTQAERSAETRARVIEAAVECITEDGFQRTTMMQIARRAGVTWGAIQHQFGDKMTILFAVVEGAFNEILSHVQEGAQRDRPLPERIRGFTRGMWEIYRRPFFRAGLEILLSTRNDPQMRDAAPTADFIRVLTKLWNDTFGDIDVDPRRRLTAQRIALATLAGLALEITFRGEEADFEAELRALEDTLVRLLSADATIGA